MKKLDWNWARAFLVTAERGSLSAASRVLGVTQPTLSRQISALEEQLGVPLFERVGRGLELTPNGIELLEIVRTMGDAADLLFLTASGQANTVEGDICISTTELVAAFVLPSIIDKLRASYPGIAVEVIASNSASDLKRREADIAIRSFRPEQLDLIAKRIGVVSGHLYSTSDYLNKIGKSESIDQLNNAMIISNNSALLHNILDKSGLKLSAANYMISTESLFVQWELIKKGMGIALLPDIIADTEPALVKVLPEREIYSSPIWLVTHRELRTSSRIRTVFDFLSAELTRLIDKNSTNHGLAQE